MLAQPTLAPTETRHDPTQSSAGAIKQPQLWNQDEFIQLSARVAAEPERVRAAIELFQARLVSFAMLKQLLDIGTH